MEAKGSVCKLSKRKLFWNSRWLVIRNRQALISNSVTTLPKRRINLQDCQVRPLPADEMPRRLRRMFAFIMVPHADEENSTPLVFAAASETELGAWLGALAAAGALVPMVALPSPSPSLQQAGATENSCVSHQSHASQHSLRSHHSHVSLESCRSLCAQIKDAWKRDAPKQSEDINDMPISVGGVSLSSCRSLLDAISGKVTEYLDPVLAPVAEWNSDAGSRTSSPKRTRQSERSFQDEIAMAKAESPKRMRRKESAIDREIEHASQSAYVGKAQQSFRDKSGTSAEPLLSNDCKRSETAGSLKHVEAKPGRSVSIKTGAEMASTSVFPEVRFQMSQHRPDADTEIKELDKKQNPAGARATRKCPLQSYIDQVECEEPPDLNGHHVKSSTEVDALSNSWQRLRFGLHHSISRKDHGAYKYWRDAKTKRRLSQKGSLGNLTRASSSRKQQDVGDQM
eukprot:gnl/MRDRNA2_/MRDRNA2_120086_c0_seq1.p1 gnl/MRDRNA2_/MRDRNA2_120086_c0~~gnl/MRDRNA2_/MRDRNA2_120086_c0_seq1.p1  ORF type:complete len:455 (-),score=71.38 gnl/MRDRNA2_/MRDRNA2_120086_c0_seq1:41-1405(-)